jgi:hypothetical protein
MIIAIGKGWKGEVTQKIQTLATSLSGDEKFSATWARQNYCCTLHILLKIIETCFTNIEVLTSAVSDAVCFYWVHSCILLRGRTSSVDGHSRLSQSYTVSYHRFENFYPVQKQIRLPCGLYETQKTLPHQCLLSHAHTHTHTHTHISSCQLQRWTGLRVADFSFGIWWSLMGRKLPPLLLVNYILSKNRDESIQAASLVSPLTSFIYIQF